MAFVLRRRRRRHRSDSPATSQLSGPGAEQLGGGGEKRGRVWTTVASGRGAGADTGGGGGYEGPGAEQRYAGNWSRVIHGDILRHGAGGVSKTCYCSSLCPAGHQNFSNRVLCAL